MTSSDRSSDDIAAIAAKLRRLEESLLDASVRRDRKKMRSMLAEDFLEFGSSGRVWTRNGIIELLSQETAFDPPAIEDFRCAFLTGDVTLVTYRTVRTDPESGELLVSLRSSIWKNESGAWRMRFHQGTRTNPEQSPR
jgi:glyoxylase I family protein